MDEEMKNIRRIRDKWFNLEIMNKLLAVKTADR